MMNRQQICNRCMKAAYELLEDLSFYNGEQLKIKDYHDVFGCVNIEIVSVEGDYIFECNYNIGEDHISIKLYRKRISQEIPIKQDS